MYGTFPTIILPTFGDRPSMDTTHRFSIQGSILASAGARASISTCISVDGEAGDGGVGMVAQLVWRLHHPESFVLSPLRLQSFSWRAVGNLLLGTRSGTSSRRTLRES